jgi:preprotein translocase subunit SecY
MTLPKAIASGPSAATPEAVRPLRVALGAGLLAALYLAVLYLVQPVPTRLVALFGGASNDVERHGGLEMIWLPPPGMAEPEIRARFHAGGVGAQLERDHDAFRIRVPGVRAEDVEETAKRLGGERGLEFHVVAQTEEMQRLAPVLGLPISGARPVDIEIDQWRPDEGGAVQTDYYLLGDTREAIDAKLAEAKQKGWQLPAGTRIAYEYVEGERSARWRTYVIEDQAALGGESIASALVSYDPNTNRPVVLLDFTREGGRTFGDLTSRIVGHKLATVIGDQVYSAPVINGPIRGGRASITMGGSDVTRQRREAEMLGNTLKFGALPKGGQIVNARHVEAIDDVPMQWLARGTLALGGGALIALLVWMVVRITRPVRRSRPARPDAPLRWGRLGVTLLAPLAVYGVSHVLALGISRDELLYNFGGTAFGNAYDQLVEQLSFGALGIMPVINAFIFVELLALIVPGWRRRRHAGPDARAPLGTAVVITAGTLLVLQSWFITQYLYALGANSNVDVLPFGVLPRMLVIASFAIGTLVLVGVAALIREHGVGNGFGVLLASGWLLSVGGRVLDAPRLIDADLVIGGITVLAIAIPIMVVSRWRIARVGEAPLRLPTSGMAPLGEAGGLVILLAVISKFPFDNLTIKLYEWTVAARTHHLLLIALVAAFTLVWSFAFARPAVTRRLAERVGLVAPAREAWWSATALSAALLLLVGATALTTAVVRPSAAWMTDAMTVALVAVVVLDIADDLRARRVALDRVWSIHQPQHADLVSRALDDAGIPHYLASTHLRTLLAFFGPFAPIDVYVPPEHAPAARARLRELVE